MIKTSVKKPFTVLVGIILVIVLGVVAFTKMTTDLLPNMELPYMVVYTTYPGASPEQVETSISQPLEEALGTTTDLKEIDSISSENLSLVVMEFSQTSDMNAISIEVSNTLDQIKGSLPDSAQSPIMMQISPDMMPVMIATVDMDDMETEELSSYLEEELLSEFERLNGVASVSSSGTISDQVRVTLVQDKIDDLNDRILREVNSELADAKEKIDDGQAELDSARKQLDAAEKQLSSGTSEAAAQLGQAAAEVDSASAQLNALLSEETTLTANQAAFQAEREAWAPYAEMNDNIQSLAKLIAVYGTTGSLPDLSGITADDLSEELLQQLLGDMVNSVSGLAEALKDPASYIQKMSDESFEAARDAIMAALSKIPTEDGEMNVSEMGSVSRADFITLCTTTAQAATRLEEIDAELNNINTELMTIKAMKPELEKGLEQAKEGYAQLQAAQLETSVEIASGSAQITVSKSSLESAQAQLDSAMEEFEEARDKAYESADISGIVTADMISNILMAENFEMPAGYIRSGDEEYTLKVGTKYSSLKQLKNTLLFSMDSIGDVRLKDVAKVKYTTSEDNEDSYALVNGNPAILLSFSKTSTASTSEVSKLINKKITQLQEENPKLHITPLMDQGDYIKLIVNSVLQNLLLGGLLAVLVLMLFLRDVRPTIVIAFSIPLSVLFAIVLMYFSNITLNMISLSGLALGIGMLVDNSIVVIENIYRLRNLGVPPHKAAVQGARQVGAAIAASTLTTICVFLPIVFTEGLTRQLFTDMGLTIAYSLLASLVVALTVVPSMSSTVLKKTSERPHPLFDRLVAGYQKVLRWCLHHRAVTLAAVFALFLFACFETTQMGMEFIPDMSSSGQMTATMTMPEDSTDEETEAMVLKVSDLMESVDGVNTVGAISGSSMSLTSSGDTSISFYILTDEKADGNEIKAQMEEKAEGLPCELAVSASAMDVSSMLSTGVQIDIYGKDLDTLQDIGKELAEKLESVEGLENISDGNDDPELEKVLTVDKDAAMRKGLTVAQVYTSLASDLQDEIQATTLTVGNDDLPVYVVKPSTVSTSNLMRQTVETTDSQTGEKEDVRLDDIASLSDSTTLASINRQNNQRMLSVTAAVDDDHNITLVSREIEKVLADYDVPEGYSIEMNGENESIMEAMGDLILMLLLAIIFIYLIMVAQFQSLLSPFIVLFTMPLAFTGGLLALLITRQNLSVIAMLGFVMLAGIVVNNGIVFVDYVNQLRLEGMEKREALLMTGKLRIRPILMTALTTILAMSTMALGMGSGAEIGQGMAIVIIGGLSYATILTLIVIPIMYDILFRRKIKKIDIGEEKKDEFDN
ncbi:MAG: efflux RND transporter permease subunit [Butyricicoccus sp.]